MLMGNVDDDRYVFPLTSLQIGDLQSYLSDLKLFLAFESRKSYILVDNRPWLGDLGSRPAHLWQLMVTKSRMSPFAHSKVRRERNEGSETYLKPINRPKRFKKWYGLVDAVMLSRKRISLPVKNLRKPFLLNTELQRTLYGFIVFEIEWSNVRGINYLNELQTDTSLAIEVRYMRRWEFNSIAQASLCISSWFSGSLSEQILLKEHLHSAAGETFYDAEETFMTTSPINDIRSICDNIMNIGDDSVQYSGSKFSEYSAIMENRISAFHTPPPPTGPYKRRRVMESTGQGVPLVEVDSYAGETDSNTDDSSTYSDVYDLECENTVEATQYKDVLILFKFNDHDLPFKLRRLIMSDNRLLRLLEAGLPSWAIFLQSYPGFCKMYRPWMCPLARALYVIISIVTVLIGFYDLYKNVPVLKATASRLCGPLFDWIEDWEMVSRIKYLGTMLFLHNFEKAVKWFLSVMRTTRSFFSVIAKPLAEPLMELFGFLIPIWNVIIHVIGSSCSVIFIVIESLCTFISDLVEILLSPVWFIISTVWTIAMSVLYPIFWIIKEILYVPIRIVLSLAGLIAYLCTYIYEMVGEIWLFLNSIFQFASSSEATMRVYEPSIWRSLWNDLFSQVFRALRSILNGFVAFFTACNRHRLSIYNHIRDFLRRYFGHAHRSESATTRQRTQ